jgi:threonine aldolase
MQVDLRSDTVTRPTAEMKEAMMQAPLGDDVLGDDPTVIELEKKAAAWFGHEAALFCPSGTMTNQIAIKVHTNAPGEVICDKLAHIYLYEGGGIGFNSGLSVRLLEGDRGRFTLEQLQAGINAVDDHFPETQLVAIEHTCNKGGGSLWEIEEIARISTFCREKKLPLHLDGARICNALVAQNIKAAEMGRHFDSISLCLSKGLGCPVGSLLIGGKEFIRKSRRIRKVFGGGMRQSGMLAAAGIYALDNHVNRLEEDHANAREIAGWLQHKSWVRDIRQVETNILLFEVGEQMQAVELVDQLRQHDILTVAMGPKLVRMVTHLDIGEKEMQQLKTTLDKL